VQLALQEFGMTNEGSLEWSLCEVTVTPDGVIKQRRLPPILENLAERIALNSRYYLKNNNRSDPLVPDELAPELLKEAQTQLLLLNAQVFFISEEIINSILTVTGGRCSTNSAKFRNFLCHRAH